MSHKNKKRYVKHCTDIDITIVLPESLTKSRIGYEQMTSFIETHGYVLLKGVDGDKIYVPQRD